MVEIIPWELRPDWLRALVAEDGAAPVLTNAWWQLVEWWRAPDGRTWCVGRRTSAGDRSAFDPRVVLLSPPGDEDEILDVNDALFDYGTAIYWTEADTPVGRRLIALLTDS